MVRPRVPAPVQVEVAEPRLSGAAFKGLPDPVPGKQTLQPKPEVGRPRRFVPVTAPGRVSMSAVPRPVISARRRVQTKRSMMRASARVTALAVPGSPAAAR